MSTPVGQIVLILIMCMFLSACSSTSQLTVDKDIVYKTVSNENLKFDIYRPTGTGPFPAVLVVHGGGWKRRSGDMEHICKELAEAGFIAFNATYRLAPSHRYPEPLNDIEDAAVWIKTNGHKYGARTLQLFAWGYSAGAHLVLRNAVKEDSKLSAVVSGGTPADFTVWPKSELVYDFLGFNITERPDLWNEASPLFHISKKTPPVFMYHGAWDKIVEVDQMNRMANALKNQGIEVETYEASYMGHIAVYYLSNESIRRGIDFLKRHINE